MYGLNACFGMVNVYDYTPHSTSRNNDMVLNYFSVLFMPLCKYVDSPYVCRNFVCVRWQTFREVEEMEEVAGGLTFLYGVLCIVVRSAN